MAETMSHVERVLWRIAELGARCSQQAAAGGRGALWAELEETIASLEAEVEAARHAGDTAPSQVRSLEGRLKVAQQERDREKARLAEHKADADAARRERDRAIQKTRKAMAVATEAKAATLEARSTAAECVARASAAENSAKKALAARDEALAARDHALNDRNKAVNALAEALTAGERAADARDEALAARDAALRALDTAQVRIAELEAALETARADNEKTIETLAARAEGPVVVLPGVAAPEAAVGPITTGNQVSWQPTWSEWARPDTDDVVDVTEAGEVSFDDATAPGEDASVLRYLNVAATIAQLLPADLGPLLLSGATVVRREGRLFATVAATDAAQAKRFADAGYKVEWVSTTPLGVGGH